jgi:hypothetical protein
VSLSFTIPAGKTVTGVRVANDGVPTGAFQAYTTPMAWTLSAGDGTKTVYVQFRDSSGNHSFVQSDDIILDTTAPVATLSAPPSLSGAATVAFDELVVSASTANVTLDMGPAHLPVSVSLTCKDGAGSVVSCATGEFATIQVQPLLPLAPLVSYRLTVDPAGVTSPLRDLAGNAVATTTLTFTIQP